LLLCGTDDGDVVTVTDYFVPIQEISKATVKNLDCIDKARIEELSIVATIHSHSSMSVFFSHTDYEKTNTSLIKNHIVVNNKGDMVATKCVDLPCGKKIFVGADVTRAMPELPKVENIEGYENISRVVYSYPKYTPLVGCYAGAYETVLNGKRKKHAIEEV
jgi:proteasome lid subunit RPN8/RPN11